MAQPALHKWGHDSPAALGDAETTLAGIGKCVQQAVHEPHVREKTISTLTTTTEASREPKTDCIPSWENPAEIIDNGGCET